MPTIRVPAVIAPSSAEVTLKVPVVPATQIDNPLFGISETFDVPALIEPEKFTLAAVIVMGALVDEIVVEAALLTPPRRSVVIVTPLVPVTFAFSATDPAEPDDV